jgi:2-oxoglutarate dehydrogenase E1 component
MMSMNDAFVDDLYFDYLRDPSSVSPAWQEFFKTYTPEGGVPASVALAAHVAVPTPQASRPANGSTATAPTQERMPALTDGDAVVPLSSIGGKIAENMVASLSVPTATSVRSVPVKALEENRRILNQVLARRRMPKLSFTHILAYAIVKAVERTPNMKNSYGFHDGTHVLDAARREVRACRVEVVAPVLGLAEAAEDLEIIPDELVRQAVSSYSRERKGGRHE